MIHAHPRALRREDELVGLLKRRQERGFRLLYEQYAPNLYGVALRIVRCPALADDVVQETFVKVWRNIEAYDPARGRLFTWLLNIVRSTALDHCRSRIRLGFVELEAFPDPALQPGSDFSKALPEYWLAVDGLGLDGLLTRLSPEHQLVLEYLYLRDHTHVEAAQALQLPLGTVKTRVRRALLHLRELTREPTPPKRRTPKALSCAL